MTGSTLTAAPDTGSWSTIFDSHIQGVAWGVISWNADVPSGASLIVTAASSEDGTTFSAPVTATAGLDLDVPDGRYLQVTFTFHRSPDGLSPVLHDFIVGTLGVVGGIDRLVHLVRHALSCRTVELSVQHVAA